MSPLVTFIVFYIVALIYVKEPHYKYIGYIMLAIIYILSGIVTIQNRELFLPNLMYQRVAFIAIFAIVFFTLFSIIKILDAYSDASSSKNSFDLKLSQRYKMYLNTYENSFIVGNVFMALGLLVLAQPPQLALPLLYICGLVAFICVWIQLAYAVKFSKIKNDLDEPQKKTETKAPYVPSSFYMLKK